MHSLAELQHIVTRLFVWGRCTTTTRILLDLLKTVKPFSLHLLHQEIHTVNILEPKASAINDLSLDESTSKNSVVHANHAGHPGHVGHPGHSGNAGHANHSNLSDYFEALKKNHRNAVEGSANTLSFT